MQNNTNQLILEASKQLKAVLWISEEEFHKILKYNDERSFDWWIYSILDDILRFCLKVIKDREILDSTDTIRKDDAYELERNKWLDLQRLIYEGIDFEFEMIKRKLSEHLILVLFLSRIDAKELNTVSQIYFLLSEINDWITRNKDFEKYYGIKNKWHDFFLNDLIEQINERLKYTDTKKLFFLSTNKITLESKPWSLFISFAKLYEDVLSFCDKKDAIPLWKSYRQYHEISKPMHAHWHARSPNILVKDVFGNITHIELICIRLLGYISLIKWVEIPQLKVAFSCPLDLDLDYTLQKYLQWDLVLFQWKIFEIIDVNKSKYWYISYRISRKIKNFTESNHVPQELIRVHYLYIWNARKFLQSLELPKWQDISYLETMTDEEIFFSVKKQLLSLLELWLDLFLK